MSLACKRGALIVFEGCDRSGKSTQCRKLYDSLKRDGKKVELMRFPDRTTAIGGIIGQYLEKKIDLEDHAVHLLFAANRREQMPSIIEKLTSGTTLIVDRYAFSGVAFTSAKGCHIEWCKIPDQGIIAPDVVFFMELTSEAASKREEFGNERYEVNSFQAKVAEQYALLKDETWKAVNGDRDIEQIHNEIRAVASSVLEKSQGAKLRKLWGECDREVMNGYWIPGK